MNQNETQWDKLLKIRTTGRDDSHADQYRYPYEPTPYCVLERLANSGMIGSKIRYWIMGQGKGASVLQYGDIYGNRYYQEFDPEGNEGKIWFNARIPELVLRTDRVRYQQ